MPVVNLCYKVFRFIDLFQTNAKSFSFIRDSDKHHTAFTVRITNYGFSPLNGIVRIQYLLILIIKIFRYYIRKYFSYMHSYALLLFSVITIPNISKHFDNISITFRFHMNTVLRFAILQQNILETDIYFTKHFGAFRFFAMLYTPVFNFAILHA